MRDIVRWELADEIGVAPSAILVRNRDLKPGAVINCLLRSRNGVPFALTGIGDVPSGTKVEASLDHHSTLHRQMISWGDAFSRGKEPQSIRLLTTCAVQEEIKIPVFFVD